jgi:peptide/nickel transport system ATP-binding protein
MYLGRIVETGEAEAIFTRPRHPYTRLLLDALPDIETPNRTRRPLAGEPPSPIDPPPGCPFHPRCPVATWTCRETPPRLIATQELTAVSCHLVEAAAT